MAVLLLGWLGYEVLFESNTLYALCLVFTFVNLLVPSNTLFFGVEIQHTLVHRRLRLHDCHGAGHTGATGTAQRRAERLCNCGRLVTESPGV